MNDSSSSASDLLYQIALTQLPFIGPVKARRLLNLFGNAQEIFRHKPDHIAKISGYNADIFSNGSNDALRKAESELAFIQRHDVTVLVSGSPNYPRRLQQCEDSPTVLYFRGNADLNIPCVVSMVGTRSATSYGKEFCKDFIEGIKTYQPLVVSGLAYGIDACSHRYALQNDLATVGCVAHGLERVYPGLHLSLAMEMIQQGGLITEHLSHTKMMPEYFPMRNRIIAGLSDCTVVVETDTKGGSMITAHIANSYSREVFALPGRRNESSSAGCNELIRKNYAVLITSPEELAEHMGWVKSGDSQQMKLEFPEFEPNVAGDILRALSGEAQLSCDELSRTLRLPVAVISKELLQLELLGKVKSLPGNRFTYDRSRK
ncbi:MAG: DNA-processing protein DprA [Flavobacteriales bacterium]